MRVWDDIEDACGELQILGLMDRVASSKARMRAFSPMRPGRASALLGASLTQQSRLFGGDIVRIKHLNTDRLLPDIQAVSGEIMSVVEVKRLAPGAPREPDLGEVLIDSSALSEVVQGLADWWKQSTKFSSSLREVYQHRAASILVSFGRAIVPHAIERIPDDPERWTWVLWRVTGHNPLRSDTRREDAQAAWQDWARLNLAGYAVPQP